MKENSLINRTPFNDRMNTGTRGAMPCKASDLIAPDRMYYTRVTLYFEYFV